MSLIVSWRTWQDSTKDFAEKPTRRHLFADDNATVCGLFIPTDAVTVLEDDRDGVQVECKSCQKIDAARTRAAEREIARQRSQ